MNPTHATKSTQFKVGLFTLLGLLLIGGISVYVNDRPFWWRPCELVKIEVDDATGLKTKSPIRSLGLEIGFLQSVDLHETHVTLGICITAPVEVLPATRAYIRGEGFLGDKFVELKPVRYTGAGSKAKPEEENTDMTPSGGASPIHSALEFLISSAYAADQTPGTITAHSTKGSNGREIPVGESAQDLQALVGKVDGLVNELTGLTQNLRQGLNPDELRQTMRQLNKTLENASKTLSPEGGLNQTAQRTLAKLEDAIEQLRDQLTRINHGEGSVGMLLNDPVYAEELKKALKNLNKLLNKVGDFRFVVDIHFQQLNAYSGTRAGAHLAIWPTTSHYYLLGGDADTRGSTTITDTQTTAGGQTTTTKSVQSTENSLRLTLMVGKTFFENRIDLSLGLLYGEGDGSLQLNLGPYEEPSFFNIRNDIYGLQNNGGMADRLSATCHMPFFRTLYVTAAIEDFRKVQGHSNFYYGAGIRFDDEDIKLLFTLK